MLLVSLVGSWIVGVVGVVSGVDVVVVFGAFAVVVGFSVR